MSAKRSRLKLQIVQVIHNRNMSPQCSVDDYNDARSGCQNPPHPSTSLESLPLPIGQFPSEVLAEVFKHCLPIPGNFTRMPKDVAPLLLCRVCSSWRTLARSTPELWKVMSMHITKIREDVEYVAAFITAWLERSGTLPLTIHLKITYRVAEAYVDAILNCSCQYALRLETVYIGYPHYSSVSLLEMRELPLLRSYHHGPTLLDQDHPFASLPRLTQLRWPGPLSIIEHPSIPWHQLTRLDIASQLSSYTILEMIQNCPELLDLSVHINGGASEDDVLPYRPRVLHKRLRMLDMSNGIKGYLLDSLTLPALKDLSLLFTEHLDYYAGTAEMIKRQLQCLFSRSECTLDKLALYDCGFRAPRFLEFLQHGALSTLTELKVENSRICQMFTDDILLQLTDTPSGASELLLPKLSLLSLALCTSASPGMLGRMVFSRCCPLKENRLKSFLLYARHTDESDEDYIDQARQNGLKVDICGSMDTDYEFPDFNYNLSDSE
ncbi:hypothetical protein AX17_002613 [Amanita inopinata Kibby_2008]|nr:hypothetical protein AX17_002613 [Amanita inopinata Kibby_2008]